MPPMILAALFLLTQMTLPVAASLWRTASQTDWIGGLLGSILGALVGGFVVWITRILGTYALGRVAMGSGDVHLMLGVGTLSARGRRPPRFSSPRSSASPWRCTCC